jgi:predicted lipid-binding transport protein (Tim44 family)
MLLTARRLALLLGLMLALTPGLADARAGGGSSMGSRGSMTYSAPPSTSTAPGGGSYMQRSITPNSGSSYGSQSYGSSGFGARPFGGGFTSGLLGGLIGAGLGGLLLGHGFFGGMSGLGGVFGLLIQIVLLVLVVRWLFRLFAGSGSPVLAGPGIFGRSFQPGAASPMGSQARAGRAITIQPSDYQAFEQELKNIQGAWSAHDMNALQSMTTPEMVSYFGEQLSQQVSRGVRNLVSDVRLDRGDLAEAWNEGGRDYATVAMRFSMVDVTYDQAGHVVDGSPTERVTATELWTFLRSPGGRWILSAIQQTN